MKDHEHKWLNYENGEYTYSFPSAYSRESAASCAEDSFTRSTNGRRRINDVSVSKAGSRWIVKVYSPDNPPKNQAPFTNKVRLPANLAR